MIEDCIKIKDPFLGEIELEVVDSFSQHPAGEFVLVDFLKPKSKNLRNKVDGLWYRTGYVNFLGKMEYSEVKYLSSEFVREAFRVISDDELT
jgi:ubiquinone/menaquinone biosynthesis C-methylase UbiE